MVEAAWHHRARYVAGKTMRDRGGAGRHVIANVAIAHELAGWCWSLAVLEE